MLSKILDRFKNTGSPMNMTDLSRTLDVDRSALDGMILQLVRQGKLLEVDMNQSSCGAKCKNCTSCAHSSSVGYAGKTYKLIIEEKPNDRDKSTA